MYRGFESLCRLLTSNKVPFDFNTNKRVQVEILSMFKLVSFESLPGHDFSISERGTQAQAHCNNGNFICAFECTIVNLAK